MNILRTTLFLIWLFGVTAIMCLIFLPLLLLPRPFVMVPYGWWRRLVLGGFRLLVGVTVTIIGTEKVTGEPVLVAAKHQAMWDTIIVFELFRDPTVVMKRELMKIPVYSWYARKFGMIDVDRDAGPQALRAMVRAAEAKAREGRSVVIFPEGTRVEPGTMVGYKPGVAALYGRLNLPCVPLALNSGGCWPGRGLGFRPGTITLEILDPIPPGLPRAAFMDRLETVIETASNRLADHGDRRNSSD